MAPRKRRQDSEFPPDALDALIGETKTPEDLEALFRRMKKALAERILGAELTHHLGYAPGEAKPSQNTLFCAPQACRACHQPPARNRRSGAQCWPAGAGPGHAAGSAGTTTMVMPAMRTMATG